MIHAEQLIPFPRRPHHYLQAQGSKGGGTNPGLAVSPKFSGNLGLRSFTSSRYTTDPS